MFFLQLQFQFVNSYPEILQGKTLELFKLDSYFQSFKQHSRFLFQIFVVFFFFYKPLWCLKTPPRFPQHSLSPNFSIKSTRKGKEPLNCTDKIYVNLRIGDQASLPLQSPHPSAEALAEPLQGAPGKNKNKNIHKNFNDRSEIKGPPLPGGSELCR